MAPPGAATPHLNDPDCWWTHVNRLIRTAYEHAGLTGSKARQHTAGFRDVFLDPATWTVYDDTVQALITLSAAGWRHVIVSNHVPELPRLVEDLGFSAHFDAVISSALIGYDKPHPEIFRIAIRDRARPVVMVGDNPIADIGGAHAVGVPGLLVRREHDTLDHYSRPQLGDVDASRSRYVIVRPTRHGPHSRGW